MLHPFYFILHVQRKPSTQIIEMSLKNIFSCDLLDNARKHLWFLKQVHANTAISLTDYYTSPAAIESIRRYQDLWLPLVAATSGQGSNKSVTVLLFPPPDIAWVWHCHRLAPKHYCDYCNDLFGYTVEANPPFALALSQNDMDKVYTNTDITETIKLWKTEYPQESFYLLGVPTRSHSSIDVDRAIVGNFNVLESMKRQATFLWQVSGKRYADDDFLDNGVLNYAKFLHLKPKATNQNIILVPTIQIDLMWHTHMLTSMWSYNKDCIRIMNSIFLHDDSYTDRSEGGTLDVAYVATKTLWKSVYGTEYVVPGGMYRGEPPKEYFSPKWNPSSKSLTSSISKQRMGKVHVSSSISPAPRRWATVRGTASDGRPSFIVSPKQTRHGIKTLPSMEMYVLGRINSKTGYYHLETREAHTILWMRVNAHINAVEMDVCMAECCCGSSAEISKYERKLVTLREAKALLQERLGAAAPTGATKTKQVADSAVCSRDGAWLYPVAFYDCAGGACGGAVVSSGGGTFSSKQQTKIYILLFFIKVNTISFVIFFSL
jgi:Glycine-rich domain-containing protein-like